MTVVGHYDCLTDYLAAVTSRSHQRCEAIVGGEQRAAAVAAMSGSGRPLAHPLAPLYLAVRAHGVTITDDAVMLGAGYYLLQHSLHIIDNVQDGEACPALDGSLGVNVGMTMFLHAIDSLWSCEQSLRRQDGGVIRDALLRSCTRMAAGQHRDLAGRHQLHQPDRALELATEKAAITTLLYELVAALVAAPSARHHHYEAIGTELAMLTQLVDDLTELFDAGASADLRTGTYGVPLNLFLSRCSASERENWRARIAAEHEGVRAELCPALFANGTMAALARLIEGARVRIHDHWRALPCGGPYLAMLTAWLDDLIAFLYLPPTLVGSVTLVDADWTLLSPADAEFARRLVAARDAVEARYARPRPGAPASTADDRPRST